MDRLIEGAARVTRALPPIPGAGRLAELIRNRLTRRHDGRGMRQLEWGGVRWRLALDELVESAIFFYPQLYNRDELDFLRDALAPGDVFVDLGSNIGFYTLLLAARVGPDGRCLAVDADPETAQRLRDSARANGMAHVQVVAKAVSDRTGTARFAIRRDGVRGSSGIVGGGETAGAGDDHIEVATDTLRNILTAAGIERVAAMKADLEGHEYPAIAGFLREAPRSLWPRAIVIEHLFESGTESAVGALLEHGYVLVRRTAENSCLRLDGPR